MGRPANKEVPYKIIECVVIVVIDRGRSDKKVDTEIYFSDISAILHVEKIIMIVRKPTF